MQASHQAQRERIKAELRIKFGTLIAFEDKAKLPRGSTKDVLRGRRIAQTERAIAKALDQKLHQTFPDRYSVTEADIESTTVDDKSELPGAHRLSAKAI